MESYNKGDLHVGGLAMIIGCEDERNQWTIGKTVTVDGFLYPNDPFPESILTARGIDALREYLQDNPNFRVDRDCALISADFLDSSPGFWQKGKGLIQVKYLMPIQPEWDQMFENEENPYKETLQA